MNFALNVLLSQETTNVEPLCTMIKFLIAYTSNFIMLHECIYPAARLIVTVRTTMISVILTEASVGNILF